MSEENIFDKESTVSQPAQQTQKILILMRQEKMLDRWLSYLDEPEHSGNKVKKLDKLKNVIKVHYAVLQPRMSKSKKEEYQEILNSKLSDLDTEKTIANIITYLEEDLKLTKIDNRTVFDAKDWGASIKAKRGS